MGFEKEIVKENIMKSKQPSYSEWLILLASILVIALCGYFVITDLWINNPKITFEDRIVVQEGPELQRITREALKK